MALALRLRRALAAASTAAPLLRPSASVARSLPLAPPSASPAAPLPRAAPWRLLPGGAAAGFRSTAAAAARGGADYGADDKIDPDEILFEGCDYNHWLITMEFPDPKPSREEMIETYLQTLAKVVGSYEEAKKRMYAFSTTTYNGFQAVMTEEMSEKFRGLPGVVFILPDSYLYPETKEYGGDKYENGVITPRQPPVHYSKPSRTDRNRNYRGNTQDGPPQQGNYPNSPPPQRGFPNSPPQQGNFQTYRSQQDGRGYAPQQNYAQAGQDARGYGRTDYADRSGHNGPPVGFQGQPPQYQGHANPAGQGYNNPQARRDFSQGQGGGFRSGGPSAPGSYGQSSTPGSYGQSSTPGSYGQSSTPGTYGQPSSPGNWQPPPSAYPGVNPSYGGDSRQEAGPAYGGDDWQRGSGQHPSPGEGQGNWQGRQ